MISEIFPSVFYVKLKAGNAIILAFKEHMSLETLSGLMRKADTRFWELRPLLSYSLEGIKGYERQENSPILTDDLSPVAKLTYPIVEASFKEWLSAKQLSR